MKYFSALGALLLFFLAIFLTAGGPLGSVAEAAPPDTETESTLTTFLTSGGVAGFLLILLGLACAGCSIAGVVGTAKKLWRHAVRGLGEGAFLLGVLGAFTGMRQAMSTVAEMGAAVTPSDLADGIAHAVVPIILGTVVALGALVGAGLIRLTERRAAAA